MNGTTSGSPAAKLGPCVRCGQQCPRYPDGRCRLCPACDLAVDAIIAEVERGGTGAADLRKDIVRDR